MNIDATIDSVKSVIVLLQEEKEGRLLHLPVAVGETIWEVIDDCDFGGDCCTKQKCKGCFEHHVEVSPVCFHVSMINDDGTLKDQFHLTYQEAEDVRRFLQ